MAGLIVSIFIMVRNQGLDLEKLDFITVERPIEILQWGIASFFMTCVILFACTALPCLIYSNYQLRKKMKKIGGEL